MSLPPIRYKPDPVLPVNVYDGMLTVPSIPITGTLNVTSEDSIRTLIALPATIAIVSAAG